MVRQLPNGARCVVLFSTDCDGYANEVGKGLDLAGTHAVGGYSLRRGIPRFLDIYARNEIPATFFVVGHDAELDPDIVRRIIADGHEVAAHGYVHESWAVSGDAEAELLLKAHRILTDVTGIPPVGWRSPGGSKSADTLGVLQDLGYIYDSSDKDFDGPYPAMVRGEPSMQMVELPNMTSMLDDAYQYTIGALSPTEMLRLWIEEFEALYQMAGYFIMTCHSRAGRGGSGLPGRAQTLDRLIHHIKGFPDVHFSTLRDFATWCLDPAHGFMDPAAPIGGRA